MLKATAQPPGSLSKGINRNVVALGIVSLLTDASTEMILPVLPLFLVGVLRASAAGVGVIEGVAECTATVLRLGSGWLSDRTQARGPLMLLGYSISGVAKGALALAGSWGAVLGLRFADRVGKGIRNPPRDAVIADSVEPDALGRAFGFHRALDTLGAAIGPLIAFAMLSAFPGDFRRIFAWSVLPAALSVLVIVFAVRVPKSVAPAAPQRAAPTSGDPGAAFRRFVVSAGLFSLANSSTAFLLLRARGAGFSDRAIPLVYLLYNLVYALLSWPVGALSDRIGRRGILIAAYLLFAGVYALLAASATHAAVIGGFALLGVHSALLEGSQRSMIADLVPQGRRATAYGIYYAVVGIALLPASILAGALWDRFGAPVALGIDAGLALFAALLFALLLPPHLERAATAGPT
jgi:MFS family permease